MTDPLKPSTRGLIALGSAVYPRFNDVIELHMKMKGVPAPVPSSLDRDVGLWAAMFARHVKGADALFAEHRIRFDFTKAMPIAIGPVPPDVDVWQYFRSTDAEKQATRNVAQWTLDLNCQLRGQPSKQLTWKD